MIQSPIIKSTPAYRYPLGYCTWGEEEIEAGTACLREQRTTMWTKCDAFEHQFAEYIGSDDAVMVNSGSSACLVMMLAARESGLLQRGDEILIPAVTWPTQVWSAIEAGFKVRLVDVDPRYLDTTPEILGAAITPKTKAIFLVHLMGNPCDMIRIKNLAHDRGLFLFEDCCEALGASVDNQKVGTFGTAATFSFFASHHISTAEGGMIVSSDPIFSDHCRLLRAHGWARDLKHRIGDIDVMDRYGLIEDSRYIFMGMGFNFRPIEIQGAIGQMQLRRLPALNEIRQRNEEWVRLECRSANDTFEALMPTDYRAHPEWFALAFVLRENLPYTRRHVCKHLEAHGIDSRPIVGGNLARHPAFWKYPDMAGDLPGANAIHDRGFYVGLPPIEIPLDGLISALNSFDPILRAACA